MRLLPFSQLPKFLQTDEVRPYYDILKSKRTSLFLKRMLDVIAAFLLMIVLLLPMAVIAVAIKCSSDGPVIYKQVRVTTYGKRFKIWKFRTMKVGSDALGELTCSDDDRVTKIGKFLRKYRLDELPQIINIFLGQMSIIGPRPALWNQDDLIAERDKYGANDVKPGLTGWAQINGRDELEIPVKAQLDGVYVERLSFSFDCKCFFGTVKSVLKSDGVVEGGTGEMKKQDAIKEEQEAMTK